MILFENHAEQVRRWPPTGRVILAQFDETSIVAYQALERRALQLGLRDRMLERFCAEMILSIDDISDAVAAQRGRDENSLETPREAVYRLRE